MDSRQSRRERREAERKTRKAQYKAEQAELKATSSAAPVSPCTSEPQVAPRVSHAQTGPRTASGKATSSMNSLRHGLTSAKVILPGESEDEFNSLHNHLLFEHKPATATECLLVRELAEQYWRLQRVRNVECDEHHYHSERMSEGGYSSLQSYEDHDKQLKLLQPYAARHERGFHQCLKTLRELQKERRAQATPAAPKHFVSQTDPVLSLPPSERFSELLSSLSPEYRQELFHHLKASLPIEKAA